MQVIGIKELQTNPGKLSKSFAENDYLLITRRGEPMGVALPFSGGMLEQGLKPWAAIKAFSAGDLSLGQLAKALNKNKAETLEMLSHLKIPVADYDLDEDLKTIDTLLAQ